MTQPDNPNFPASLSHLDTGIDLDLSPKAAVNDIIGISSGSLIRPISLLAIGTLPILNNVHIRPKEGLTITLPDLPWAFITATALLGAGLGWLIQSTKNVTRYNIAPSKDNPKLGFAMQYTRPAERSDKILNALQGTAAGADLAIILDSLSIAFTAGEVPLTLIAALLLIPLCTAAIDTNRLNKNQKMLQNLNQAGVPIPLQSEE